MPGLNNYPVTEIRKAMIDAGYPTYTALARKVGRTPQAVIKVIKKKETIPSKSLARDIYCLLKDYLSQECKIENVKCKIEEKNFHHRGTESTEVKR